MCESVCLGQGNTTTKCDNASVIVCIGGLRQKYRNGKLQSVLVTEGKIMAEKSIGVEECRQVKKYYAKQY